MNRMLGFLASAALDSCPTAQTKVIVSTAASSRIHVLSLSVFINILLAKKKLSRFLIATIPTVSVSLLVLYWSPFLLHYLTMPSARIGNWIIWQSLHNPAKYIRYKTAIPVSVTAKVFTRAVLGMSPKKTSPAKKSFSTVPITIDGT